MRKLVLPIALLMLAAPAVEAQKKVKEPRQERSREEVLNNQGVMSMVKSGLSTAVIINKIASTTCSFDLSAKEMAKLKKADVSDEVIAVMMRKAEGKPISVTKAATTTDRKVPKAGDLLNRFSESGIYFETRNGKYIQLEPSVATGKSADSVKKTVITSVKNKISKTKYPASIEGKEANYILHEKQPVFYIYINEGRGTKADNYLNAITSGAVDFDPADFKLIQMNVKDNKRELATGPGSGFALEDETISFTAKRISNNLYAISPEVPLENGEYCFFYSGSSGNKQELSKVYKSGFRVFDFGVSL